jgi:hypothetical protein
MKWVRDQSLTLFFTALFLASLIGQALVGHSAFNHEQVAHGDAPLSLGRYVTSSPYWVDVTENWQSEYLQFSLMILATIWLMQRGSTESKPADRLGTESDKDQKLGEHVEPDSPKWATAGGLRTFVYSWSLLIVMGTIWIGSWFAQAVTGRVDYNAEQLDHHLDPVSLGQYLVSSDFWNRTLQNWQSEFLAVASMAIFSVYWRARGSAESKPVGAAHDATGEEG